MYLGNDIVMKLVAEYDVGLSELRTAALAVILGSKGEDAGPTKLKEWIDRMGRIMSETEIVQALAWAEYIKKQKEAKKDLTVQDVLQLKEQTVYV